MTYNEYISQFSVFDNPPKKKGFHRHHIVPKSEQIEPDERQIYLLKSQHLWAHILYDREHKTNSSHWMLSLIHKSIEDIECYEDCLIFDDIPEAAVGHYVSDEVRKRVSETQKGNKNSLGRHHSDETKRKLSEINKGKYLSEETKKKIGEASRGRKLSEEAREKLRQANLGKHPSEETLVKLRCVHKNCPTLSKRVQCFTKDGQFKGEYPSVKEAERKTGINHSSISAVCRGERNTAGTLVWRYA